MPLQIVEIDLPARTVLVSPDHLFWGLELFDAGGLQTLSYGRAVLGLAHTADALIHWTVRPYRREGLQ